MADDITPATHDDTYELVSVLSHALEGADVYSRYRHDAERLGDTELAAFFGEVLNVNRDVAQRAKRLLAARLLVREQVSAPLEPRAPH